MSAEYRGMGVAFQFPENWELEQEPSMGHGRGVTVSAPSGGFWSLAVYPRETDSARLVEGTIGVFRQEYEEVETEPVTETVEGWTLTGADVDFFCLDLIVHVKIRTLVNNDSIYVILTQGEGRELQICGAVFDAITVTLLRSLRDLRADWGEVFSGGNGKVGPENTARQFHETPLDAPLPEEINSADWAEME